VVATMLPMEGIFVDEARIYVAGGDGGNGCSSFLREKFRPKGRPDGGNGGNGGNVLMRVDANVATLSDLARNPHQRAERARNGQGRDKHGGAGANRVLLVPNGTVVRDESGELIADLVGVGTEIVVARGGRAGRGNAALVTPKRRAPGFAERGGAGEVRSLLLELKVLADVGLVGFPNAGKSSLISRLSAARPKVAAYPFTTLTPNLGVAEAAGARFVVADVPGLIEGASTGKGLGLAFLRHLERCRVLCFVLDVSAPEDPAEALAALRAELNAHAPEFDERPGVVVANKIDVDGTTEAVAAAERAATTDGFGFVAASALRGDGTEDCLRLLGDAVARANEQSTIVSHRLIKIRPEEQAVVVEREDEGWRVRSERAARVLERFDITNPEALAYVQERLISIGVEEALARAGARIGDEVRIGDYVFDFTPEGQAGAK